MDTHLCQWTRKMITIIVHQMISIATKLITNFINNSTYFFLIEIGATNLYTLSKIDWIIFQMIFTIFTSSSFISVFNQLPKSKLFAQFTVITWWYFKNTGKWKWMTAISKFSAINFNTWMINAKTQICRILVYPILTK